MQVIIQGVPTDVTAAQAACIEKLMPESVSATDAQWKRINKRMHNVHMHMTASQLMQYAHIVHAEAMAVATKWGIKVP